MGVFFSPMKKNGFLKFVYNWIKIKKNSKFWMGVNFVLYRNMSFLNFVYN